MNKKSISQIIYIAIVIAVTLLIYLGVTKRNDIVIVKLTNINGGEYVESAGLYEGNLFFENVRDNTKYAVTLCTKNWPKLYINSDYKLNLKELETNTRLNGMLAGCYLGDLDLLFKQ